jgi:Rrf2 family nitric oxide-sensitive transcriptional repressor
MSPSWQRSPALRIEGGTLKLTTFTDYSLRVLISVATAAEGRTTIAEIARAYGISEHHVVKVAHLLGRAGFLANTRGRGGGLSLARPAAAIRVGDVVRAAEGDERCVDCEDPVRGRCAIAGCCRLAGVLEEAMAAFHEVLDNYTLEDLLRGPRHSRMVAILHPRRVAA